MKSSKIFVMTFLIICMGISLLPLNTYADKDKDVIVVNTSVNPVPVNGNVNIGNSASNPVPVAIQAGEAVITCTGYRFIGYSTQAAAIGPGQMGILYMNRLCQTDFGPSSRMCTTREFLSSPVSMLTYDMSAYAWIQPSPVGISHNPNGAIIYLDYSGEIYNLASASCGQWTSASSAATGATVHQALGNIVFWVTCDGVHQIACCAP
jgi:hypothetical protein